MLPTFLLIALGLLTLGLGTWTQLDRDRPPLPWVRYLWTFLLVLNVAAWWSFVVAVWLLALFSLRTLREYFSLVDIRLEDRWGILAAYLSIPFMTYLIQVDWYGFFIVSIPVYAFVVIPFLVAAGGEPRGSLWSIGAIDFGLFFFVYGLGHLIYLAYFSRRLLLLLLLLIALSNLIARLPALRGRAGTLAVTGIAGLGLCWLLRGWAGLPVEAAIVTGLLVPLLVWMGEVTVGMLERDLGIDAGALEPGRGRVLDALKSYLFAAPVAFHVLRWLLRFGEDVVDHGF